MKVDQSYKNKKVVIMGLGLNSGGLGSARYFADRYADVLVTDLKSEADLKPSVDKLKRFSNVKFVLGKHREVDFENADIVVASPAVPPRNKYLDVARKAGADVFTPMSFVLEHKRGVVIGITGTKGKSTTTNLIYQVLKKAGKRVLLGGNIGISEMEILPQMTEDTISVLEISNFMLEYIRDRNVSLDFAVLTSIMRDHLNRHKTMKEYIDVKSSIVQKVKKSGTSIINDNLKDLKDWQSLSEGEVKFFRAEDVGHRNFRFDKFHPLSGAHNLLNIAAATKVVQALGVSNSDIVKAVNGYEGLYGRQMYLGSVNGVHVVNDTCATTPDAVVAALKRFSKESSGSNVVLLTGGTDKELDFNGLAKEIKGLKLKDILFLSGSGTDKLLASLKAMGVDVGSYGVYKNLKDAVKKALGVLEPDDIFLFSPGGSSFELFKNEFDRGAKFDEAVEHCTSSGTASRGYEILSSD